MTIIPFHEKVSYNKERPILNPLTTWDTRCPYLLLFVSRAR